LPDSNNVASSSNGKNNKDSAVTPGREDLDDHKYNDPDLPPMEFLLAVMHDRRTPMAARIDAAKAVSVYMHPRLAQVTQETITGTKIIIEGGLPPLPGTNIIMPSDTPAMHHKTNGSGGHEG
jgi:hypothetical protein